MQHAYCTYFDHNYLPRGVLAIRSLRLYDSESPIYVLALSPLCAEILGRLALPGVEVIPLARLEHAFGELEALKAERSTVEYFFTLTPFWPLYLLASQPVEMLTYIDADFYFLSSPASFVASIADASIAITPHRFSALYSHCSTYGRFNVGWMSFRRCAEALNCLLAYKTDCTAWCYDRVEDEKFADQGYLDSWPDRYPGLRIIEHKGVNTAVWNADAYEFRESGDDVLVDGEPLICYHFHGVKRRPDGSFDILVATRHRAHESVLVRRVLQPYLDNLAWERADLHRRFPALAAAEADLRATFVPAPAPQQG